MVEMKVTLRLSSLSKAINSGPLQYRVTAFLTSTSETLNHPSAFLTLHLERLVMSSLYYSPSFSSPPSSSSSSGSSTIEPLLVGAI